MFFEFQNVLSRIHTIYFYKRVRVHYSGGCTGDSLACLLIYVIHNPLEFFPVLRFFTLLKLCFTPLEGYFETQLEDLVKLINYIFEQKYSIFSNASSTVSYEYECCLFISYIFSSTSQTDKVPESTSSLP